MIYLHSRYKVYIHHFFLSSVLISLRVQSLGAKEEAFH